MRNIIKACVLPVARLASNAYIAGPELKDAVKACQKLSPLGTTIGFWNSSEDVPAHTAGVCLAAVEAIKSEVDDCYLSVKAPALNYQYIDKIAEKGAASNVGIHFDSHGPEEADATFESASEALQKGARIGCTLPGRWQRSAGDVDRVVALNARVRIVKGQWVDPAHPDIDMRGGYLEVVDAVAGRVCEVGVATHDPGLARESLKRLKEAGTPCELELLYGLPMKAALRVARELDIKARVYVPFGEAWLPYALSQVKKNPRVMLWVMRDIFSQ